MVGCYGMRKEHPYRKSSNHEGTLEESWNAVWQKDISEAL